MAEQASGGTVDRKDQPVLREQRDHSLHVVHDGPEHVDVTLVEVELVTISRVASDDDDEVLAGIGLLHGGAQLKVDPCAATVACTNAEQLARFLAGRGVHQDSDQIQIIRMDEEEYRCANHSNQIPTENFSRSLVRVVHHARCVDCEDRIAQRFDRRTGRDGRRVRGVHRAPGSP